MGLAGLFAEQLGVRLQLLGAVILKDRHDLRRNSGDLFVEVHFALLESTSMAADYLACSVGRYLAYIAITAVTAALTPAAHPSSRARAVSNLPTRFSSGARASIFVSTRAIDSP